MKTSKKKVSLHPIVWKKFRQNQKEDRRWILSQKRKSSRKGKHLIQPKPGIRRYIKELNVLIDKYMPNPASDYYI